MSTHFLVYLLQYSYKQKRISRQFVRVGLQPLTRVSFCPCMLTCTRISHARTMLVDCNQIASVTLSLSKTAPPPRLHYLCFTHSLSRTLLYWLLLPNQFLPDIWQQVIIRKKKQKKTGIFFFSLKKIDREMMKKEKVCFV